MRRRALSRSDTAHTAISARVVEGVTLSAGEVVVGVRLSAVEEGGVVIGTGPSTAEGGVYGT